MGTVYIFHGVGGHAGENWFPWLANELTQQSINTIVPSFPDATHPKLDAWLAYFEQFKKHLNEDPILVGHSLGGAFALRLLERLPFPVRATYLVAAVWTTMDNPFDPLIRSFVEQPFDWMTLRRNAGKVHVLCSDNDPYIAVAKEEELAGNLGTEAEIIHGAGHFNEAAGYRKFPALLEMIEKS